MKIHVGCGKRNFGIDWVHVDGASLPHVVDHDVMLTNFRDNTADLIYASHIFEYWDREEGKDMLCHWKRVLKDGGKLRLAVPDFENMIHAVQFKGFQLRDILGPLYGKMQMGEQTIYHKTVYNFSDLKEMLERAGFRDVKRYDWRETDHAQFDDHSQAYLPHMDKDSGILISLNMEATK